MITGAAAPSPRVELTTSNPRNSSRAIWPHQLTVLTGCDTDEAEGLPSP
jgi:hypothetical protein